MSFTIGVDLGGTNLRIAAVSEQGEVLQRITARTRVSEGREVVIREMVAAIREIENSFYAGQHLLGVGIGVPGIIDARTGMLRESPNLPGWSNCPIRSEIEHLLGAPVVLENDANVAALGEAWLGAGCSAESMCMVTLGTGVGGGIVMNGSIWSGLTGMAAEIGHITVEPDGPRCGCGNFGCVEQFASAPAILRMAGEVIASGNAPELAKAAANNAAGFNARVVQCLAVQGDKPAQVVFARVGRALGIMLAGLVNALNLHVYVIGGGVSEGWASFAPAMLHEVQRRSFVYRATAPAPGDSGTAQQAAASRHTIITKAQLGPDAGLIGAARLPVPKSPAHNVESRAVEITSNAVVCCKKLHSRTNAVAEEETKDPE